jgi:hypothetical protein
MMFTKIARAALALALLLAAAPAWAATNFLLAPGTNGSTIATPLVWMTTELNALASGACATSSVGGSSGVYNQTNTSNAPTALSYLTSGGAFTPITGQGLYVWFLHSYDGGTHFEALKSTCSTTIPPLARPADMIIPFVNAAYATSDLVWGPVGQLPWDSYKIEVWNIGTTALPATGNVLTAFPTALQY